MLPGISANNGPTATANVTLAAPSNPTAQARSRRGRTHAHIISDQLPVSNLQNTNMGTDFAVEAGASGSKSDPTGQGIRGTLAESTI
jgi:hypothetical protein